MDLRMVKTRNQIKDAFLTLRQKFMPENIMVKDICRIAMINKTTFYNHYTDSTQLSNEIDDGAIDRVISSFFEKDKLLDDPKAYIQGLLKALGDESHNLKIVFRGKADVLSSKLEKRLHSFYESRINGDKTQLGLSFAIGGCVRAVQDFMFNGVKCDVTQFTEATTNMLKMLLNSTQSTVGCINV